MVFHLPSTPWAAEGRSIRNRQQGCTRFGLQRIQRGSLLVELSSHGTASPAFGERRAPEHCVHEPMLVQSGLKITIASGQIGCALFNLPSADPPELLFGWMLPPWRAGAGHALGTLQKPSFRWPQQTENNRTIPKFSIAICKPSTGQAWHGNHS